ncbi:Protein kinase, variant 4 [Entomophthora muscae]|uniref:Protein kinase, variant 4 n=2 Tax=Entomophthora muscae TaxID=34485 RepID=A0ACC2SJV4_9FUNG|nr:Protein kinase, variant 4 [Entomophthora muscae]
MASNTIQIGQYNVLQTIGEGSFGKVKLAVHSVTGHKVAMKIINRKKIAHMDMVGRVKREIQYLKLLRHPHIIKLYEVITTPTDIIMVIEYAGRELFDFIVNNGKMPESSARRFFQQIICAVEYCHRHKIVHRDLKPENLLLDPFDNVKIADFGLSNIMSDGDFLKTSCGSPNYAAPEVIGGKLYAGPEVDVWSCGVILFVMLCGRLPFDDEYIPYLFKKITEGLYDIPQYVSNDARQLLSSMLVVDPLQRITIQEVRQHPWFLSELPDYLSPLPSMADEEISTLDEGIIKMLEEKMSISYSTIVQALEHPDTSNQHIKVAYQLVIDHTRVLDNAREHPHQDVQQYLISSSPPTWTTSFGNHEKPRPSTSTNGSGVMEEEVLNEETCDDLQNNTIRILGTSLPQKAGSFLQSSQSLSRSVTSPSSSFQLQGLAGGNRRKTRSKWHFGIRSRNSPTDVMLEIYRALKQLNMVTTQSIVHLPLRTGKHPTHSIFAAVTRIRLDSRSNLISNYTA